jgi:hypothetical protein
MEVGRGAVGAGRCGQFVTRYAAATPKADLIFIVAPDYPGRDVIGLPDAARAWLPE